MMKHKLDSTTFIGKRWKIKELENSPIITKLSKILFLECTHGNIWTFEKEEIEWARMVGFT
jgi:hypothetical protein